MNVMRKDDTMSLPNGWEKKKLGEVCETGAGGTPLKSHKDYYVGGNIPWLLSGEVSQGEIFEAKNFITKKGLENSSAKLFPKNSVLIAMYGATAGQVGILRIEASTNQAVCGIFPNRNFIPEYLFYCFLNRKEELVSQAIGNAQPNISQEKIRNTKIPIPPLSEQKRIVSILDRAFAAIDKAKANTEKNLQNAKELFESYLQKVFGERGEDWEEKRLGDISFVKSGGTPSRNKAEYWNGDIAWYSSGELNNLYTTEPERYINQSAIENSNAKVFPKGSLLIGMYDTAALKMSILDRDATFNQAIAGVKPTPRINLKFIRYSINAIKSDILDLRRGVRQKNLSLEKIKDIRIPTLSLRKQNGIVDSLDLLKIQISKLAAAYQQKLISLDELKKSVLQKAFSGELTADAGIYETKSEALTTVAEPRAAYLSKTTDELTADEWLQLYFMLINIGFHNGKAEQKYLAEVKMEKSCHIGEYTNKNLLFNRNPFKAMNGPADFDRLYKLHDFAEANGIFIYDKNASYKKYIEGENFMKYMVKAMAAFRPFMKDVNKLLTKLLPLNTDTIDLYTTTYTAWNNLLILKKVVNVKSIAKEGRWHQKKNRFTDKDFENAIEFLKTNGLVPDGKGKLVTEK